jgi:hypothetical protein
MAHRLSGGGRIKRCSGIEACEIVDYLAGQGLTVDDDTCALAVTTHDVPADPDQTLSFTVVTDSALSLDAKTLTLQKTYTTYNILRSFHGQFLRIEPGNVVVKSDVITLPDVYGYGNVSIQAVQHRQSTKSKPNFYSKG